MTLYSGTLQYDPERVGPMELAVMSTLLRQESDPDRPGERAEWIRMFVHPVAPGGPPPEWTASLPLAFVDRRNCNNRAVRELLNHASGPLIEQIGAPAGEWPLTPLLALTETGRAHYRRYAPEYRELFPELDLPDLATAEGVHR